MKAMTTIIEFILACSGVVFLYDIIFVAPIRRENDRNKSTLAWYDTTYLQRQGSTSTYGKGQLGKDFLNYDLRSWDGGQTWYAVKSDFETRKLVILGEADSIYPNLLSHLNAWDSLTAHVEKNGAIGSHPITDSEIKIMEKAGFTVKQN